MAMTTGDVGSGDGGQVLGEGVCMKPGNGFCGTLLFKGALLRF